MLSRRLPAFFAPLPLLAYLDPGTEKDDSHLTAFAIVLIVIGVLAAVAIVAVIFMAALKYLRKG